LSMMRIMTTGRGSPEQSVCVWSEVVVAAHAADPAREVARALTDEAMPGMVAGVTTAAKVVAARETCARVTGHARHAG